MAMFVELLESLIVPCSGRSEEMIRVCAPWAAFVATTVIARLVATTATIAFIFFDDI
jgi:hypothetical protein